MAGLNETLSKLSGQMGGMPSGEGGGIYDMQEGMNVALPSDEDEEGPGGNDWGTGETGYGGGGGGGATMQQGYGAPTGAPPGQPEPAARPVWNRTEEGRKEMEALGEILAERVIGQEAAVDMVATTMQMCYVGLQASSGKKTGFLSHLYVKVIFLPRQARDKHRENSKKARFLEGPITCFRQRTDLEGCGAVCRRVVAPGRSDHGVFAALGPSGRQGGECTGTHLDCAEGWQAGLHV